MVDRQHWLVRVYQLLTLITLNLITFIHPVFQSYIFFNMLMKMHQSLIYSNCSIMNTHWSIWWLQLMTMLRKQMQEAQHVQKVQTAQTDTWSNDALPCLSFAAKHQLILQLSLSMEQDKHSVSFTSTSAGHTRSLWSYRSYFPNYHQKGGGHLPFHKLKKSLPLYDITKVPWVVSTTATNFGGWVNGKE